MKKFETKKLHYERYLYKLVLFNRLNTIFRTELQKQGKLSYAREYIDKLNESYQQGKPLEMQVYRARTPVPADSFLDAKDIYTFLKSMNDYKVRVDPWGTLTIYSNEKERLLDIAQTMRTSTREFWEPDETYVDLLIDNSNTILIDEPTDFPIKVTLGRGKLSSDLGRWLAANPDKSKVGDKALAEISRQGYVDGLYFYVKNEKILSLLSLIASDSIRRIDKLVYKHN